MKRFVLNLSIGSFTLLPFCGRSKAGKGIEEGDIDYIEYKIKNLSEVSGR